jgi:hypothetical protein
MKYHWIGHFKEGTSDKVWGLIKLTDGTWNNDYVAFWGRRGKALQTKIHTSLGAYDADKLCDKKEDRGYKSINPARLDEVYPEFEEDLQKTAIWAMLKA